MSLTQTGQLDWDWAGLALHFGGVLVAMFFAYVFGYAKGRKDECAGKPDSWI